MPNNWSFLESISRYIHKSTYHLSSNYHHILWLIGKMVPKYNYVLPEIRVGIGNYTQFVGICSTYIRGCT